MTDARKEWGRQHGDKFPHRTEASARTHRAALAIQNPLHEPYLTIYECRWTDDFMQGRTAGELHWHVGHSPGTREALGADIPHSDVRPILAYKRKRPE